MRMSLARIRGVAFILWHARHEFYHMLLGLVWAWVLREVWEEFNVRWIMFSVVGSLLPDAEHFLYFATYGRKDTYTRQIGSMLLKRQWRALTVFVERGHKYQTDLSYHNIYTIALLLCLTIVFLVFDWRVWVILTGAMIIHYLFDIVDDIVTLGYVNPNWKRWGNGRKTTPSYRE
jgi:hypothetical protein